VPVLVDGRNSAEYVRIVAETMTSSITPPPGGWLLDTR
jgi:hypothetical protein